VEARMNDSKGIIIIARKNKCPLIAKRLIPNP
jgi:hypothetical protein